jgi:hypothetical protein
MKHHNTWPRELHPERLADQLVHAPRWHSTLIEVTDRFGEPRLLNIGAAHPNSAEKLKVVQLLLEVLENRLRNTVK